MSQSSSQDAVFHALAHVARRQLLDLLVEHPGMSVAALASHFPVSRIATMKHLSVLEAAQLVLSEKKGKQRLYYFNPMPIQLVYDRWTTQYSQFWSSRLADLKTRVESKAAKKRKPGRA